MSSALEGDGARRSGVSCSRISFEVVVLPQPGLADEARASRRRRMAKSMPSTAFTQAVLALQEQRRCRRGSASSAPATSSTGAAMGRLCRVALREPAPGRPCRRRSGSRRALRSRSAAAPRGSADGRRSPAAGCARSGGWPGIAYSGSLLPSFGIEPSRALRVRVLGGVEQLAHRRLLDDLAGIHHRHLVAHLARRCRGCA